MSPARILIWSGPRTISTALMRSWGSRDDVHVWDEPLYAAYLAETGIDHPGREEILARHETDWRRVVERILGDVPGGKAIHYQKHMAHHLLPGFDRSWVPRVRNAFLIRDPREMLISLSKVTPDPGLRDTGLPQQAELFERVREARGRPPPVVDARDVLEHPETMLRKLCRALGVPFRPAMLSWEPGRRETDGAWAEHWYDAVEASTGFRPWSPPPGRVPAGLEPVLEACREPYRHLREHRIRPGAGAGG